MQYLQNNFENLKCFDEGLSEEILLFNKISIIETQNAKLSRSIFDLHQVRMSQRGILVFFL